MIELSHIDKSYQLDTNPVPVLHDISLSVQDGEYLSIMGPSGSGKSTLMNIIGCLDMPTAGTYLLDGMDVGKMSENNLADIRARKIGFVFQNFELLPKESALSNVALPLMYAKVPRKERRSIAETALERVGLKDQVNHLPNQLSGGQKQRVAIARAIINKPSIILADEPTGALDQKSGAEIMDLFSELNESGITIIMITHDANIARHAQRTIHIIDGRIIQAEEVENEDPSKA
ncbi:MAG: ABC transporter ATP-binding protein [Lachnospiraceae bacterium]|nr:ABC transporter ATP-binding protein [Lachnospiraceae bacterium]